MGRFIKIENFVLLGLLFCWGAKVESKPLVQAFYVFGDSTIDSGNNNQLATVFKSNFPPYGMDFPGGIPTGRFSDGRLVTDMLSSLMGLPDELPAYLDPNFTGEQLLTGASFGSAGAGIDDTTSLPMGLITLSKQLDNFKSYKEKLAAMVGDNNATEIISGALFALSMGTKDFVVNYYMNPITREKYTIDQFQDLLLHDLQPFIQKIYNEGATKFVIFGVPPFGCLPLTITLNNPISGTCVDDYNNVATSYNNKLAPFIDSMKASLPALQIAYIDIYNKFFNIIQDPTQYGFEEVRKSCCGTGKLEAGPLCNTFSKVCDDVSKHLFWDSIHPTSRAYNIIANDVFKQIQGVIF
ncbi:hypothetical protein SUGI_0421530 [Cryptomeria japonica]|uniref:GDSL esterase/lipase At5g45960-like n=1 Tax=Cryptomeria japonica TaxID=3369 RepID=UPI002408E260|nr:GDSL esterase/lipase At5g45960-like [Cryptomeria japonica]GLJ22394.1 hypothetical protein SUGI_0421530 [Cryptomeria japonica]